MCMCMRMLPLLGVRGWSCVRVLCRYYDFTDAEINRLIEIVRHAPRAMPHALPVAKAHEHKAHTRL